MGVYERTVSRKPVKVGRYRFADGLMTERVADGLMTERRCNRVAVVLVRFY